MEMETDAAATDPTDRALVAAARAGDGDAYARLVERHAPRLLGLARHLLGHEEDAEDAVQETFVRAHRALGGFRGDAAVGTWLYRIALNACRDAGRTRAAAPETCAIEEAEGRLFDARYTVDPERVLAAAEEREALARALATLPTAYREAVLLHDREGFTMAEVAEMTEVPLPTAKSWLRRGRLLLVDVLAGRPEPTCPTRAGDG